MKYEFIISLMVFKKSKNLQEYCKILMYVFLDFFSVFLFFKLMTSYISFFIT